MPARTRVMKRKALAVCALGAILLLGCSGGFSSSRDGGGAGGGAAARGGTAGAGPGGASGGSGELVGTDFDIPAALSCNSISLAGGATGWLKVAGNVVGGEIIRLRIAIWDTGDSTHDSTVTLDNFRWSTTSDTPVAATP